MPLTPSRTPRGRGSAFTLIELLTVIAIIGILAAITIPTVSKVRARAYAARCLSNLRQIGMAVHAYSDDNKGFLPGPMYAGQGITVDPTKNQYQLGYFLSPYIGDPQTDQKRKAQLFICPAWAVATAGQANAEIIYQMNNSVGSLTQIWGYPGNGTKPRRLVDVFKAGASGKNRMLYEIDQTTPGIDAGSTSWFSQMAEKPPHGTFYHVLFFDAHVEPAPVLQ